MTEQRAPRRRGRPRGGTDSRERIVSAAVDEFGAQGYDGATVRSIAARAGVDSALVHHYFGTKADLFAEAAGIPLRPDLDVPEILAGPKDEAGSGSSATCSTRSRSPTCAAAGCCSCARRSGAG